MALGWPGNLESHWTTVGDTRFHALRTVGSESPDLVVVHGLVVASRSVAPLLESFGRRNVAAWAPDLPGFGLSTKPARALDVDELAAALGLWLEANAHRAIRLLGVSFGTQIAAALSHSRPDLVDRLTLFSPTVNSRWRAQAIRVIPGTPRCTPPRSTRLARRLSTKLAGPMSGLAATVLRRPANPAASTPSLAWITVSEWLCAGLLRASATVLYALTDDIESRAATISTPTLVLRGASDRLCTSDWIRKLASRLRNGRAATLDHGAHSAQFAAPDALADHVVNSRAER